MTTRNVVADGRVPNELLGSMHRKMHEIVRRTDEGTLDPQWVVNRLQEIVEGRMRSAFLVWKTVKLGTGLKTADDFRRALKGGGFRINDWADDILGKPAFTVSETEMSVDLVNVSVAGLGFKDGAYRRNIIAKALEFGLRLCPAEVGPQLRLQYADQPKGERLVIGMEPITDLYANPRVFGVEQCDGVGCLLDEYSGSSDNFWDAVSRFVFMSPSK